MILYLESAYNNKNFIILVHIIYCKKGLRYCVVVKEHDERNTSLCMAPVGVKVINW